MSELDDTFIKRIQDDLSKNSGYKLFMEQDNYVSEEAVQYVLFIMDHYIKYGGEPSVDKIRFLFGMNEGKAELTIKTLKGMGLLKS
jgi:hypothetical protein